VQHPKGKKVKIAYSFVSKYYNKVRTQKVQAWIIIIIHIRHGIRRKKTGAQNIVKEIKQYQKKWLQHVQRMYTNRIPKQALQYKPKGRRNIGRLRKRWRDQFHLEGQGRGNTPNLSRT
jgi:hypothetical protein